MRAKSWNNVWPRVKKTDLQTLSNFPLSSLPPSKKKRKRNVFNLPCVSLASAMPDTPYPAGTRTPPTLLQTPTESTAQSCSRLTASFSDAASPWSPPAVRNYFDPNLPVEIQAKDWCWSWPLKKPKHSKNAKMCEDRHYKQGGGGQEGWGE